MLLLCAGLYAALAGFLFGYDLGCINGALPVLLNDTSLALSDEQAEQIVAHCKVGAAVGALISILLMQHGHLRSFWVSSLCFVAGPLLLAGSRSWPVLALGRFITGLAVGVSAVAAPTYLADIAPPRVRGCIVGTYELALTCGMLIASAANTVLQLPSVRVALAAWMP